MKTTERERERQRDRRTDRQTPIYLQSSTCQQLKHPHEHLSLLSSLPLFAPAYVPMISVSLFSIAQQQQQQRPPHDLRPSPIVLEIREAQHSDLPPLPPCRSVETLSFISARYCEHKEWVELHCGILAVNACAGECWNSLVLLPARCITTSASITVAAAVSLEKQQQQLPLCQRLRAT